MCEEQGYQLEIRTSPNGVHLGSYGFGAGLSKKERWSVVDLSFVFAMWVVMMVAMMIPSAVPTILVYSQMKRKLDANRNPLTSTAFFILGYLAVWAAFSLIATLAQWGLFRSAQLSSRMGHVGPLPGGGVLLVAGIYQWTSLKYTCLGRCRTPVSFLLSDWKEGIVGTFVMGLGHGWFCALCCWGLMALMFVAGVMNVLWMALLAAFVLIEKIAPGGDWLGRLVGVLLGVWGIWLLVVAL